MMNYIATQLAAFFIIVWEVPKGSGKIGIINQNTEAGWLPVLGGQRYLLPILLVAILTGVMYIYLNYSKHGYEIAVVGESQRTASYAGIKVERVIVRTMILSGAICGLIGLLLTAGTDHTLTTTIVGGRGFTAVMVSLDGQVQPHHDDLHEPSYRGSEPRRERDLQRVRPEPLLRRYPDGHHPLLHHRQRVFHQLQGQPAQEQEGGVKQ